VIQIYYSYNERGPKKVIENLKKGLDLIGVPYEVNSNPKPDSKKICLSSHDIMHSELIKELYIGPNICTLPIDNDIAMRQEYKAFVVNSKWTYDAYKKWIPEEKLRIWPVGIDTDLFSDKSSCEKVFDCLLYCKGRPSGDLATAKGLLESKGQKFTEISYGGYSEQQFLELIEKSRYAFVVDGPESQGIAIEEMMSCNLPVFVWDVEFWADRGEPHKVPASSVPFWSPECGIKTHNVKTIADNFEEFLKNIASFSPRQFILRELTLEKQAKELVEILK
jgi:hypothetical protein